MLRHDNMVMTIRGRLPNRTAKEAVYPTTTEAPSGIQYGIMKTVITQALTAIQEAIAMVEVTEAQEIERATEKESDTGKKAQHKPEETGGKA